MAVEKTIKINTELAGDIEKRLAELEKQFGKVSDAISGMSKKQKEQLEQTINTNDELNEQTRLMKLLQKTANASKKGVLALGKGFKGLGLAMKTTGVLLVVEAFNLLKEALMSNQTVMDAVEVATTAIGEVMGVVTNAITSAYESVKEATGGFDAMKEVIGSLLTIALQPLVITLNSLKLGVLQVQKAYERWLGGNDAEKIAELNAEIEETTNKIIEAGKTVVDEAVNIGNNIGEAVGELVTGVTEIANSVTEAVKDIELDDVLDKGEEMLRLRKEAELADIRMSEIATKYAEDIAKATAQRDKENASIATRLEKQAEIDKLIKEQLEAEKAQLNVQLANLKAIAEHSGLDEDRLAVREKMNEIAEKQNEIDQAGFDAQAEADALAQEQRDAQAEARARAIDQRQLELDLENELLLRESEKFDHQKKAIEEIAQLRIADLEAQMVGLDAESELYKALADEKVMIEKEAQAEIETIERDSLLHRRDMRMELEESVLNIATSGFEAIGALAELHDEEDEARARRAFNIQKKLSQGQAIIATYQAMVGAMRAEGADGLLPFYVRLANAGIAGVAGFAQVAQIRATQFDGGGGSGGGSSVPTAPQRTPQFNVVGTSGTNQLAQSLGEREPVQAYVVGSDVSSQQELDRKKVNNASL